MRLHVCVVNPLVAEPRVAGGALVGPLGGVNSDVRHEEVPVGEGLLTDRAGVRPPPRVDHHVSDLTGLPAEGLLAHWAAEGLLFGVRGQMRRQAALEGEGLRTNCALERLVPRVDPHVFVSMVLPGEFLLAERADEKVLPRVDPRVELLTPLVDKCFLTDWTAVRLLPFVCFFLTRGFGGARFLLHVVFHEMCVEATLVFECFLAE